MFGQRGGCGPLRGQSLLVVVSAEQRGRVRSRRGLPESVLAVRLEPCLAAHRLDGGSDDLSRDIGVVGPLGVRLADERERVLRGEYWPVQDTNDTGRGVVEHARCDAEARVRLDAREPVGPAILGRVSAATLIDGQADVFGDVNPPPMCGDQQDADGGDTASIGPPPLSRSCQPP